MAKSTVSMGSASMVRRYLLGLSLLALFSSVLYFVPGHHAGWAHAQNVYFTGAPATFVDANGVPCAGCFLHTYVAGGTTPQITYGLSTGGSFNTNPIVLNSAGQANIWLIPGVSYRFDLYSAANVLIWTVNNIPGGTTAGQSTVPLNYVFAGPTVGTSAAPAFRALVSGDIPATIASNTTGNAATATAAAATPTGCGSNQYARLIAANWNLTCSQPAFPNITPGLIPATTTFNLINAVDLVRTLCDNVTAIVGVSHPTANPSVSTCYTGTNTQFGAELFSATNQTFQVSAVLPDDWVSGSGNDLVIYFADITDTNIAHNEVFNVSTACTAVATPSDPSFNTAQKPTTTVSAGAAASLNTMTLTGWTSTGCAASRILWLKIGLDSTRTATGNASVLQVHLKEKVTKVAQ